MNLSRLVCATGFVLLCTPLNAATWEYRKCAIDAVFSGVNVPATSIPGSSFVGWARTQSGTVSAKAINILSAKCLSWALSRDAAQIPNGCENNPRLLNNSEKRGKGLTNGLRAQTPLRDSQLFSYVIQSSFLEDRKCLMRFGFPMHNGLVLNHYCQATHVA